jgi:peptide-methionine (S)-S-oxide reductase
LGALSGVIRTRVGYTGGTTENPTYYDLGDHSETVQLDFDPSKMMYEALVEAFFAGHDATRSAGKRQYMSAIFVHDSDQERIARSVMQRLQSVSEEVIQTQILPAAGFYLAEDYHQKYALQGNSLLLAELRAIYPDFWDLVDSTAATRLNAYLYGYGTPEQLRAELNGLGLSAAGEESLLSSSPAGVCPVD